MSPPFVVPLYGFIVVWIHNTATCDCNRADIAFFVT